MTESATESETDTVCPQGLAWARCPDFVLDFNMLQGWYQVIALFLFL